MWANAGNEELAKLSLFTSPTYPAFGGRQAFGGGNDVFYGALRSVSSAARTVTAQLDRYITRQDASFVGAVAFPVIVIDGGLFSASFEESTKKMQLEEVSSIRIHWKGDPEQPGRTTIDVVTRDGLEAFIAQRAEDTERLLKEIHITFCELQQCSVSKDMGPLNIKSGSTGMLGRPRFLLRINKEKKAAAAKG